MGIELPPRVVFASGIPSGGKTTTLKEITKQVSNAFYLDRDDIIFGILHVAPTITDELPAFEKYVKRDTVFPNNARSVETPFGEMIQVDPLNAFNRRHGRDQTYMVQTRLAKVGLELGKISLLDCFLPRQIKDGTLKKIMEQPDFGDYPKFLIHFIANEEVCYQRSLERIKESHEEDVRYSDLLKSRERFHELFSSKFKSFPEGIEEYKHLLMDTSEKSPEDCAKECIEYISR